MLVHVKRYLKQKKRKGIHRWSAGNCFRFGAAAVAAASVVSTHTHTHILLMGAHLTFGG